MSFVFFFADTCADSELKKTRVIKLWWSVSYKMNFATNASLHSVLLKRRLRSQQSPVIPTQATAQTYLHCWRALQLSLMLSMNGYLMETHSLALSWEYFWGGNLMNKCTAVVWATPSATQRPNSQRRIATLVGLHVASLQCIFFLHGPTSIISI